MSFVTARFEWNDKTYRCEFYGEKEPNVFKLFDGTRLLVVELIQQPGEWLAVVGLGPEPRQGRVLSAATDGERIFECGEFDRGPWECQSTCCDYGYCPS